MFADRTFTAMVPAKDFSRALKWYEDKLGLTPKDQMAEADVAEFVLGDGFRFFLYATSYAGTAQHTLLTIDSQDLDADMAALRGAGVVFEDYDIPGLKTENGVAGYGAMKNAWFKDSEGNIIGLVQAA